MLGDGLGAGDERGDLLFLADLPRDVVLDIGMVDVDDDHLGGAAGGAARLDGARGAVADLQEAHQARRLAAAGQGFAFAAQIGEVGAGAGAVFEQARLADPQIHDAAVIDQIVGDGLDEAGMRLRMLVGRGRAGQFAGAVVDVVMALAGTVDAVGPVQAGVEPLRRVRRDLLGGEHVGELVLEGGGVLFRGEIAALPAPVGPGAGEPVEDLACVHFRAGTLGLGQLGQRLLVGDGAPEEGGNVVLLDLLQRLRHARLAEIFLRQDVAGDLAELGRHVDAGEAEDHRTVGVLDLACRLAELDRMVGALASLRVPAFDLHAHDGPRLFRVCRNESRQRATETPSRGALSSKNHRRAHVVWAPAGDTRYSIFRVVKRL